MSSLPLTLGEGMRLELHYWLATQIGREVHNDSVLELFERVCAARNGGAQAFCVWGAKLTVSAALTSQPDWTVRVRGDDAVVQSLPFGEAWRVSVDELVEMLLQWFDDVSPSLSSHLRSVLVRAEPILESPTTAATVIAALLSVANPSATAIGSALGMPLHLTKVSESLYEFERLFCNGLFSRAVLRHNIKTNSATLTLSGRFASVRDIDARELGVAANFAGFNFERPEGAREQYRLDLGSCEVRFVDPARNEGPPSITIQWPAVQRIAPLPKCLALPESVAQLIDVAGVRTPNRYWLYMRFDGQEWTPAPPLRRRARSASRVELSNLDEFAGTREHRGDTLLFVVELFAREQRLVAGSDIARETLHARILSVCVAPAYE